jgi:hypothetical protein
MTLGRSLGKNHLAKLPKTFERMRSTARSHACAVFVNIWEERMPRRREIPD